MAHERSSCLAPMVGIEYSEAQVKLIRNYQRIRPSSDYAALQISIIKRHRRSLRSPEYAAAQVSLIRQHQERVAQRDGLTQGSRDEKLSLANQSQQLLLNLERGQAQVSEFTQARQCSLCDVWASTGMTICPMTICLPCVADARYAVAMRGAGRRGGVH